MAEGLDGALDHPRHVFVLRDVRFDGDGIAARLLDRAYGDDIVLGAEPGAGDGGALAREAQRRGAADAGPRPGDDRRLALQPHVGLMHPHPSRNPGAG